MVVGDGFIHFYYKIHHFYCKIHHFEYRIHRFKSKRTGFVPHNRAHELPFLHDRHVLPSAMAMAMHFPISVSDGGNRPPEESTDIRHELCIKKAEFCNTNDEICIKNDEFCIESDEFCIKSDEFYVKSDEHERALTGSERQARRLSSKSHPQAPDFALTLITIDEN